MNDAFISYSRKDSVFMKRLLKALTEAEFETWVDEDDIPKGERFLPEIYSGIEGSDTFLLIVTHDSLASKYCNLEIAHALELKKRVVPIIRKDIDEKKVAGEWFNQEWEANARTNWKTLRTLNWLFFRETDDFDTALNSLMETLRTDVDYVRSHTRYLERAIEWEKNNCSGAFLLRGEDLVAAQLWLVEGRDEHPKPTALHEAYIRASKLGAIQRRRVQWLAGVLIVAGIFALLAAAYAGITANNAMREADAAGRREDQANRREADANFRADEAVALVATAQTQVAVAGETLTPIPITLTVAADTIRDSKAEVNSLQFAANALEARLTAQDRFEAGNASEALAYAIAANTAENPDISHQRVLAEIAYSPGARQRFMANAAVNTVAFSQDGQLILLGSDDGTMTLWDITMGEVIETFDGHSGAINAVAFSHNDRMILSGSDDETIKLWDISTTEVIETFDGHSGAINAVAFSHDDRMILSGSDDETIKLWDISTTEVIETFDGHSGAINAVTFSHDDRMILSGSDDETIKLWDITTTEVIETFDGHTDSVLSIAISSDDRWILSGSDDTDMILWDITTGDLIHRFESGTRVLSVAISADNRFAVSATFGQWVILWDLDTGEEVARFAEHSDEVRSIALSPVDNTIATGGADSNVYLWDAEVGFIIERSTEPSLGEMKALFNPIDPNIVVFYGCRTIVKVENLAECEESGQAAYVTWDLATGMIISSSDDQSNIDMNVILASDISPDGAMVVSTAVDETLFSWNPLTGAVNTIFDNENLLLDVAFSPINRDEVLLAGFDNLILWNTSQAESVQTYADDERPPPVVTSVAFAPDSNTFVSGSEFAFVYGTTLTMWDVDSANVIWRGEANALITTIAFSPDGQLIASGHIDGSVNIWNAETGLLDDPLLAHSSMVEDIAFSPDGTLLATGSDDTNIRVWNVQEREIIRKFDDHSSRVLSLSFAPDGRSLLSTDGDGTFIRWRIDTLDQLIAWAQSNRYVPDIR